MLNNTIQAHFANHIGNQIFFEFNKPEQRRLVIYAIYSNHITGVDMTTGEQLNPKYHQCKLIFSSKDEFIQTTAPPEHCVIEYEPNKFIPAIKVANKKFDKKFKELLTIACECNEITVAEFYQNVHKKDNKYLWPRQIMIAVIRKLEKFTLEKTANFFDKDHATVLHSIKKVRIFSDTDKEWRVTNYDACQYIIKEWGVKNAELIINTKWFMNDGISKDIRNFNFRQ